MLTRSSAMAGGRGYKPVSQLDLDFSGGKRQRGGVLISSNGPSIKPWRMMSSRTSSFSTRALRIQEISPAGRKTRPESCNGIGGCGDIQFTLALPGGLLSYWTF